MSDWPVGCRTQCWPLCCGSPSQGWSLMRTWAQLHRPSHPITSFYSRGQSPGQRGPGGDHGRGRHFSSGSGAAWGPAWDEEQRGRAAIGVGLESRTDHRGRGHGYGPDGFSVSWQCTWSHSLILRELGPPHLAPSIQLPAKQPTSVSWCRQGARSVLGPAPSPSHQPERGQHVITPVLQAGALSSEVFTWSVCFVT